VVYTIKMPKAVFVLHAFQKKSKQGIKTPQQEIELVKRRLKEACEIYKELGYEKKV
jgi:phage-related protein